MKKIDEIFKRNLEHGTAPYSDDLWSKIERQLEPPSRKTRYLPFILGMGMILIFAFVGMAYLYTSADSKESFNAKTDAAFTQVNSAQELASISTDEMVNLDDKQAKLNTESANDLKATFLATDAQDLEKEFASKTDNSQSKDDQLNIEDKLIIQNNNLQNQHNKIVNTETKLGSIELGNDVNTHNASRFDSKPIFNQSISSSSSNSAHTLSEIEKIHSIHSSDYTYQTNASLPIFKNIVECSEEELPSSGFALDLYFSPEYAVKDLNSKTEDSFDYLLERERTENAALSFSTGVRISYKNASGLTLRSGVNYSQINEAFDYVEQVPIRIDTMITIITETDPEGQETTTIDTTTSTQYATTNFRTRNNFKSIDVPVLLGLEMPVNERLSLSINTGVYINAVFSSSGRILSPELEPIWFTESSGDSEIFKSRLGVSFYGSIGLHHELSPGLELLVEPNMRYYSQSFTIGSYPLTQDYIKLGVLTGLRYRF